MKKYIPWLLVGIVAVVFLVLGPIYQRIFAPNVVIKGEETRAFYIPAGYDYVAVGEKLLSEKLIKDPQAFHWVAEKMNYPNHVYPGRYILTSGMSTRDLVTKLRSGSQDPMDYTFVKFRTLEDLASHAATNLMLNKSEFLQVLNDKEYLKEVGGESLTPQTVMGLFIPNTYELYWTISSKELIKRMYQEYKRFWESGDRNNRRRKWGLTRLEVMTLASIVEEETNKVDEKPKVAGVYLNRIRTGMPLQADPTVRFAVGDFTIKRILNKHLEIDSPYNTYMHRGIPPGPICTPSISSIDAVINGEKHKYFYFCARIDGNGYHQFSKTLTEHLNYANQYHKMLNQKGIMK